MNKTRYYNNYTFRLASPLILGIAVYLLVLLFFDSVDQITTNFFSREVLFVIVLTIVFLELNRMIVIFFNWIFPDHEKLLRRIVLQTISSIIITGLTISVLLYFYFVHFEGFSTISTELITFNFIYFFVAVFYNIHFFSIIFLYKRNDEKLKEEYTKKATLELEMETFKNQVNPDFLFQSLEIIISELYKNKNQADELVNNLAMVYRHTLENKDLELIPIQTELGSLLPIFKIFKTKYGEGLSYNLNMHTKNNKHVIPGTLQIIFENAIFQNIISDSIRLKFDISILDDELVIKHTLSSRLRKDNRLEERISKLKVAYSYFSKIDFSIDIIEGTQTIRVPAIEFDEE